MLHVATHLASAAHADDATWLARALGGLSAAADERLDALHALVRDALDHPELVGSAASNLAGARLLAAQHLLDEPGPIERLRHSSTTHLLAHEPEVLARQARLLEPLPRPGTVRVAINPTGEPDHWSIDIACRDADGLLARLLDVLDANGLPVVRADIATWPDGAVLDTFVVRSMRRPSPRELGDAIERRLRAGLPTAAPIAAHVEFDNGALPWLTVCSVSGPDQPELLRSLALAFARAEMVVHSARLSVIDGEVAHRFGVTDRFNRKLDGAVMARVTAALATGRRPRTR